MKEYAVGLHKHELETPALCLDYDKLEGNIQKMAQYLGNTPVALRPHAKTHKSPMIAWMQLRNGAIGITCAKVGEAEVLASAGIRDILIANQVIGKKKIERLMGLAAYTDVMTALDTQGHAKELSAAALKADVTLRVIIEVDVGMSRCGTAAKEETLELARTIEELPGLKFEGIMGYEGHAVMITDSQQRQRTAEAAMERLTAVKRYLEEAGIPVPIVSAGGTGTYRFTGNYPEITELQAGSYATMDLRYQEVGIDFQHALTLTARVISCRDDYAITDAGLKSLTSEFGMPKVISPEGWETEKLSEEHGKINNRDGSPLQVGDTVEFIPSHGCTTINLHDTYYVTRNDIVIACWPVAARGAVR